MAHLTGSKYLRQSGTQRLSGMRPTRAYRTMGPQLRLYGCIVYFHRFIGLQARTKTPAIVPTLKP